MHKKNYLILSLVLISLPFIATGQATLQDLEDAVGFEDDVNDVPINGLIALGMAVASYLGYKKFKK